MPRTSGSPFEREDDHEKFWMWRFGARAPEGRTSASLATLEWPKFVIPLIELSPENRLEGWILASDEQTSKRVHATLAALGWQVSRVRRSPITIPLNL